MAILRRFCRRGMAEGYVDLRYTNIAGGNLARFGSFRELSVFTGEFFYWLLYEESAGFPALSIWLCGWMKISR